MKALLLVGAWTCWGLLGAGCGSTLATRGDVDLLFDGFEDAHGVPELNGTAEAMRVELAERMAWAPGASFVLPYEAGWVVEAPSAATDAVVHGKVVRGPRGLVLELTLKTPRGATIWRGRFDEHEVALAAHELARALGLTVAPQGLTLPEPTQRPLLGSAAFELEELVYSGKHGEVPLGELPNDDWGEVVRAGAEAVAGRTDRAVAILKSVIERTPNLLGARAQLARLDAGARPDEAAAIEQLQLDGLVFALQANPRMATLTELYARAVRAAMDRLALGPRDHIAKRLRQGSLPEAQRAALAEVPALWQRIEGLALTPEQRAGGLVEVAAAELLGHDPAAAEASLVALRRVLDAAPGPLQVEGLLSPPTLYAAQLARRARVELFRQAADATPQALREADPEIDAATVSLDARDCSGATLLHVAAERGDVAVLDALLARGADPLAANLFGETPLHRAARAGQVDSLRRLTAADRATRLEAFDDLGRTPLATAVAAGQLEVTRALIALGASLRARDVDGRTPLHIAARLDAGALVAALVAAHAPLESGDIDGATPLVLALEVGAAGAFDALVQAGAEVGPALIEPRTLSLALASRHPDIVARLAAGLQARAPNLAAQALAAAFRDDVPPIVAALLAVGAKPPLEPGETPLHVAARYGAEEVVADLVKRGAALEALDARGQTPLRTAIVAESLAAVEALTKGGASLAPGVDGLSALDFALLRSPPDDDIVTALAGPADLAAWAYLGDAQAVERALAADPQAVSRLGRDGLTPLHHAVRGNQPAIAQLLIQRGASPTMAAARHIAYAPEIEGWTPMHFAFAQLEEPMIQILRAAGARSTARTRAAARPGAWPASRAAARRPRSSSSAIG
ncbi:MAG: ankyrin repeat domain-containing protein [Myxococcota bacterium]